MLSKKLNTIKTLFLSQLMHSRLLSRAPLAYSFLVTNDCQLRCKHCFYTGTLNCRSIQPLSIDEYRRISITMDRFNSGVFSGGEPFLRKDHHEIIKLFHKNNKMGFACSITNGIAQKEILYQVKEILSSCADMDYNVCVSIDGFKEQHDYIRNLPGCFEKAVDTFRELKKLKASFKKLQLTISAVMCSYNQGIMRHFIEFAVNELKPDSFGMSIIRQNPQDLRCKNYDYKYYIDAVKLLEELILENKFPPGCVSREVLYSRYLISKTLSVNRRQFLCRAGNEIGFVDCDGAVNLCEKFESSNMGNLRDYGYDFKELWFSKENVEYKKRANRDQVCDSCTHESQGIFTSIGYSPIDRIKARNYFRIISAGNKASKPLAVK